MKRKGYASTRRASRVFKTGKEEVVLKNVEEDQQPGPPTVVIDGSQLEGGGQIIRNTAALAAISGQRVRVHNVRRNRKPPGLQPQHCCGWELVACICNGAVGGAEVHSEEVQLWPRGLEPGHYVADPGTAGSCTLLAQAALPCLLFAGLQDVSGSVLPGSAGEASITGGVPGSVSSLQLTGGTDLFQAPSADYMQFVLVPTLKQLFNLDVQVQLHRRGFYPKGNGSMTVSVPAPIPLGSSLPAFKLLNRGAVTKVWGRAFVAGVLPARAAQELADAAETVLRRYFEQSGAPAPSITLEAVQETAESAYGNGAGVVLVANTDQGCILGASKVVERGKRAADVGREAAEELVEDLQSGACVDRHMQDQLVVFMAAAEGTSQIVIGEPTLHTQTALWVAEALVKCRTELTCTELTKTAKGASSGAHTSCTKFATETWLLECEGVGLQTNIEALATCI